MKLGMANVLRRSNSFAFQRLFLVICDVPARPTIEQRVGTGAHSVAESAAAVNFASSAVDNKIVECGTVDQKHNFSCVH
jgi:hypothetical protein